jgi:hypothetical protein
MTITYRGYGNQAGSPAKRSDGNRRIPVHARVTPRDVIIK